MSTVLKSVPDSPDKLWGKLRRNDPEGEAYLAGRGLGRAVELDGLVRFNDGAVKFAGPHKYRVVLALHDTSGEVAQLQARAINPEAKGRHRQRSLGISYPPDGAALGKVKEARTAKRVYLTEGIADTLALLIAGVTAIGAPGTGSLKHLPKFLGKVKGREIVLCVQNDEKGQSAKAFADVEKALRKAGATVIYLRTPQDVGKDPADWLKKIGEEAFTLAAESAVLVPETAGEATEPEAEPAPDDGVTSTSAEGYQELESACAKIAKADGKVANAVYAQAARIGGLIAGGEVEEAEAIDLLRAAAREAGLRTAEITGHVKRGIAAGKKEPRTCTIRKIAAEYAFVAEQNRYYNVTTGGILAPDAMDTKYRPEVHASGAKGTIAKLINPHMARADNFGWYPGKTPPNPDPARAHAKDRIFTYGGKPLVNTWRDPPTPPTKCAAPRPWLEHVEAIVPNKEEREHLLDVLAYNVQHLDGKVNHAIVLQGARGIGKDTLFKPLARWLGDAFGTTTLQKLDGRFGYHFKGCKILYIGEAHSHAVRDSKALYDNLKTIISADVEGAIEVEEKFAHPYKVPNLIQLIFSTNYQDGLYFDTPDDRGHFVLRSPAEPKSAAHYDRLHKFLDAHWLDVIGWLNCRSLAKFNPKAPALHTKAREEMHSATRSAPERIVARLIDELGGEDVFSAFSMTEVRARARDGKHVDEPRAVLAWLDAAPPHTVSRLFADRGYSHAKIDITDESGKATKRTIYWKGTDKSTAARSYREGLRARFGKVKP